MPSLLQPRLCCFYCGSRSAYAKDGKTRQFTCASCDATNHLDQKGEITDPPTTPCKRQTQVYAHARAKSASPITHSDDNLFCNTCIKNQYFLTQLLSEYLPSEDDAEYEKYEREYPAYRKDLERRYPQVCHQCAPRVQERIHKTSYAAKVDFLTRSIEHSKNKPLVTSSPPKSILKTGLMCCTLAWWVSMLVQALWHLLGLLAVPADQEQVAGMRPLEIIGCTVTAAQHSYLPLGCSHLFVHVVRLSLQTSLYLAWWNPALKTKLNAPGKKSQWTGLADFYRFQAAVLFWRFAVWWKLSTHFAQGSSTTVTRALHGLSLLVTIIGIVFPQRMVKYVRTQRISFRDTTAPLVEPDAFQYPTEIHPQPSSLRKPPTQPFNISNLSSRSPLGLGNPVSRSSPLAAPPTPPASDTEFSNHQDAADSMDWEPLPRQSSPLIRRTQNPTVPQMTSSFPPVPAPAIPAFLRPPPPAGAAGAPSPFVGRLPPAPISPAHRLRNPPPQPQFKPTPLSKQQDFFKQMGLSSAALPSSSKQSSSKPSKKPNTTSRRRRRDSDAESEETVPSDTEAPQSTYVRTQRRYNTRKAKQEGYQEEEEQEAEQEDMFRPARWTLKSDLDAAAKGTGTGLEDMFSSSFKLGGDTPTSTPRAKRTQNFDTSSSNNKNSRTKTSPTARRREVGGDGREWFERASAQTGAAAQIVRTNGRAFGLSLLLALAALAVAMLRDASVRAWISDVCLEPLLGVVGLAGRRRGAVGSGGGDGESYAASHGVLGGGAGGSGSSSAAVAGGSGAGIVGSQRRSHPRL
ncbi:hypothetical protein AAFC00_002538 [Neodothiora populina]|uniref:Ima1 N-terminal domain-containing protein n=1 Tax=Neodothiora populina TaxID=2781224 RepID=A0ABR3P7F4_9PEZI